jgi:hypothetical protein
MEQGFVMEVLEKPEGFRKRYRKLAFTWGLICLLLGSGVCIFLATRASAYRSLAELSYTPSSELPHSPAAVSLAAAALDDEHLTLLMDEFGLYAMQRKNQPAAKVIAHMRSAIELKPVDSGSIRVAFTGEQAIVVEAVTNFLAEFIEADAVWPENVPSSGAALRDQPPNAKPVPAAAGTPPLAAAAIKAELQRKLYLVNAEIDELNQDQISLHAESVTDQNKLEGLESRIIVHTPAIRPTVHTVDPAAQERATFNQQLTAEKQHLSSLRERYTEAYPDVQTSEEFVTALEGKIAALPAPITQVIKPAADPNDYEQQIDRLTVEESRIGAQLRANDSQIASLKQKRSALQSALLDNSLVIITPVAPVIKTPVANTGQAVLAGQSPPSHPFQIIRKASSSVEVGVIDRRIIFSIAGATLLLFLLCVLPFVPSGNQVIVSVEDLKRNLPASVPYLGEIRRIVP